MAVFKVKILNGNITFRDDFRVAFKDLKDKNEGNEFILELTLLTQEKDKFDIYYKTEVLPRVQEWVNNSTDKKTTLSINEIDFMLRNLFMVKRIMKLDGKNYFDFAKEFTELNKIEQLNVLSSINLWCWNMFKLALPKFRLQ